MGSKRAWITLCFFVVPVLDFVNVLCSWAKAFDTFPLAFPWTCVDAYSSAILNASVTLAGNSLKLCVLSLLSVFLSEDIARAFSFTILFAAFKIVSSLGFSSSIHVWFFSSRILFGLCSTFSISKSGNLSTTTAFSESIFSFSKTKENRSSSIGRFFLLLVSSIALLIVDSTSGGKIVLLNQHRQIVSQSSPCAALLMKVVQTLASMTLFNWNFSVPLCILFSSLSNKYWSKPLRKWHLNERITPMSHGWTVLVQLGGRKSSVMFR